MRTYMDVQPTTDLDVPDLSQGAGETAVMALARQQDEEPVIISDDNRFLATLTHQGIQFTIPSDLVAEMAQRGTLSRNEAQRALERLRPFIRERAYHRAMQDIEGQPEEGP